MVDLFNYMITRSDLLFSHIVNEVDYSKGILSSFPVSSKWYDLHGGLGAVCGGGVHGGVALALSSGVDVDKEG